MYELNIWGIKKKFSIPSNNDLSICKCDPNGKYPSNMASDMSELSVSIVFVSFSMI